MRAPAARWAPCSGVVFRGASDGFGVEDTRAAPLTMGRAAGTGPWLPAPPLSLEPERFRTAAPTPWGLSGGRLLLRRPASLGAKPELSSVHQPVAVLLPERFRGGCA